MPHPVLAMKCNDIDHVRMILSKNPVVLYISIDSYTAILTQNKKENSNKIILIGPINKLFNIADPPAIFEILIENPIFRIRVNIVYIIVGM